MEVVVEVEVVVEAEVVVVEVVAAAEATEYLHRDVPEGHHQIAHEEAVDLLRAARRQRRRRRAGPRRRVGDRRGRVEDFDGEELRRRLTRVLLAVVEVGRAADGPLLTAQARPAVLSLFAVFPLFDLTQLHRRGHRRRGRRRRRRLRRRLGRGGRFRRSRVRRRRRVEPRLSRLRRAHCEDEARRRRRLLVLG